MTMFKLLAANRARLVMLTVLLGLSLCLAAAATAADDQAALAHSQAKHWLGLLAKGDYAAAYRQSAPVLQKALPLEKWQQTMSELAAKTGPAAGRKLLRSQATKDLPGAPKGEYYLLVYSPNFAKMPQLMEQVAMLKCADGKWRVAGYYLK